MDLPKKYFEETNLLILLLAQLSEEDETEINRVKTSINKKSGQSGILFVNIPRIEGTDLCPAGVDSKIDEAFTRIKSIM